MTNEEIQKALEFMMQWQEVFAENMQRLEENHGKLQEEVRELATAVRGLTGLVGQLGEAQIQTQNDLSHLTKIVPGLVEIVTRDRNGGQN